MKQPELRPLHYTETAYDSRRDGLPPDAQEATTGHSILARSMKKYVVKGQGIQCKEFPALDDAAKYSRIPREQILEMALNQGLPFSVTWKSLKNPRVVVESIKKVSIFFLWISTFSLFFFGTLTGFSQKNVYFDLILITVFFAIYIVCTYLLKQRWLSDKNNIHFERGTGMVELTWKRRRKRIPFRELEAAIRHVVGPAGELKYHLFLYHRPSGVFMQSPREFRHHWQVELEWEYLQQYMDVSQPLPDVPWLEPFRHLDPTTVAHDRAIGRPEVVWGEMTPETATEIHDWSREAAKQYPWGLTREEALALGWRPSGYGDRDWFWEHLPEQKAAADEPARERTEARAGGTE